jgi:Uma2 family endonuclease
MASVISPPDSKSSPATMSPSTMISQQKTELPQKTILPSNPIVRHRFTIEQYHGMIDRGIFAEDEPIELIRGEIVRKMPMGNPHAATVNILTRLLSKCIPDSAMISIQNPVLLSDSEPEPDVAILNFRDDLYAARRPVAQDVLLLIEVADSSLAYDRDVKGPIYAEAGVCEYWIVNLLNSTVEVYRDPQSDGRFATVTTAVSGEILTPLLLSGLSVPVDEVLGLTQKTQRD